MRLMRRLATTITLAATLAVVACVAAPTPALGSTGQISISQDGPMLARNPSGTLSTFHRLGVDVVRMIVLWSAVAPNPRSTRRPSFNASNPAAYPVGNWALWDAIVRDAQADRITLDLVVSAGSPRWADRATPPGGYNPYFAWWPSASQFGAFVHAVGERYSGTYKPRGASSPLPRVSFWTLYNEPNFGEDLGPQAIDGSSVPVAAMMYRSIVDASWSALQQTGHGHDTILIGEVTARGSGPTPPHRGAPQGNPGNFGQSKPLAFLRNLYCVGGSFRELRGRAAR